MASEANVSVVSIAPFSHFSALIVFEIESDIEPFSEEYIQNLYLFSKEILTIDQTSYVYSYAPPSQ